MSTFTWYEIPTIASPQSFNITLAGVNYSMRLVYEEAYAGQAQAPVGITADSTLVDTNVINGWVLDIIDGQQNPLVCGIPLVTGIDLLYQYQYLGIGGALVVATDGATTDIPTFDNLGSTGHLYFVVIT